MPMSEQHQRRRSRVQLVLIFVLFLIPPVSAWIAWQYLGEHGVDATTNAGTLVSPARPLQIGGLHKADGTPLIDQDLRGRWTYVVFAPGDCDKRCEEQLYLTRQIRVAMNKDMPRVQRLLVLANQPSAEFASRLAEQHADLHWVVRASEADALMQTFEGDGFAPSGEQYFLVDPLGNLMMFYDLGVPAKGMMKDLQKLLKISQIG